jgi:hypothetical protein
MRVLMVPVTPWDRIHNGWGLLNLPRMLLGFLPGFSVVVSQLGPWLTVPMEAVGLSTGRTFAPEQRPERFTSSGIGMQRQYGGAAFARMLLPAPGKAGRAAAEAGRIDVSRALTFRNPAADENSLKRAESEGLRAWWTFTTARASRCRTCIPQQQHREL